MENKLLDNEIEEIDALEYEDIAEEYDEAPAEEYDDSCEPELEVVSEDEIIPYEVVDTEIEGQSTKEMAKQAKLARKEARREMKKNEVDRQDDGSIFKMKPVRNTMSLVYLLLLIAAIGIPVGLLVYTIMAFFL